MRSFYANTLPNATQINAALFVLRIASAMVFLYHGSAILFGAFKGPGPRGFAAAMHHAPVIIGYLVGLAEVCGGLAMLTGLLIRIGALCIIVVMLGAIFLVHLPHGLDIGKGGYEYALTELLVALALLITGAGTWSLAPGFPLSTIDFLFTCLSAQAFFQPFSPCSLSLQWASLPRPPPPLCESAK